MTAIAGSSQSCPRLSTCYVTYIIAHPEATGKAVLVNTAEGLDAVFLNKIDPVGTIRRNNWHQNAALVGTTSATVATLLVPEAAAGKLRVAEVGELAPAAEGASVVTSSASRELVPVATKSLGEWGETRLAQFLGGRGVKPSSPFSTPFGKRYPDQLLDGISYESKAGLNVKLTSSIQTQINKDAFLINKGIIKGAEWHFWRGATPEVLQALQTVGIKGVVH